MTLILIVDDEKPIRELLAAFFEDVGYRVVTATNGREALERVRDEVPDLVLTDLMMPVLDGVELVAGLRGDPHTARVPVLLASAVASPPLVPDGVLAFVRKPYDLAELEALVGSVVAA